MGNVGWTWTGRTAARVARIGKKFQSHGKRAIPDSARRNLVAQPAFEPTQHAPGTPASKEAQRQGRDQLPHEGWQSAVSSMDTGRQSLKRRTAKAPRAWGDSVH
ncbi:hypothetical protein HJFPF1_01953 [Paramyrothecium foliicola]|nr:hypothetical protein HJFPF1_01953 [Paramyrothecium foliicola]